MPCSSELLSLGISMRSFVFSSCETGNIFKVISVGTSATHIFEEFEKEVETLKEVEIWILEQN